MAIDKGLSFRVEATPHEGIGSKGLSVKVKVRKKQDAGTQYDTILKIKKVGSRDKTIHLVQSEETMTSFDMLVEKQKKDTKKKNSIFRNFKPGGCLDPPFGEDRLKYTPTSTAKSASTIDCKKICKYKKHESPCVAIAKEDIENPIEKSSSASVLSLFKDIPASSLNAPSSNTIITYPTHAKRSKVSTTSSKKSIDENRKKSFSQTTELYFKPKSDETGAKSPSKVSKKNISREGHRSVDSDALLPYIQEVAKTQMQYIQDDPIFYKSMDKPEVKSLQEEPQPVPVSNLKIQDDTIITDQNNKRNDMLTGRSATLSDAILKRLHDNKMTSENDNNKALNKPIASTAGVTAAALTSAGLTVAGLTVAAGKQAQDEKTSTVNVDTKKEDQNSVTLDDKMKTEKSQDTKDHIDSVSIEPQILKEMEKPNSLNKQASNKDMQSESTLSKNDAITITSQEPGFDRLSAANMNEVTEQTPVNDSKSKSELKPIEKSSFTAIQKDNLIDEVSKKTSVDDLKSEPKFKLENTSFTATQNDTLIDNEKIAPSSEKMTQQPLSIDAIKDIKSVLTSPETEHLKSSVDQITIQSKSKDKEVINTDNKEFKAGAEKVSLDTKNKDFFTDTGSMAKILETKPTHTESRGQEHDSVMPVFDASQSKNTSLIALAQDLNEQSKVLADSRISSHSQISKVHSSDIKVRTKVSSSPRESTKSLKLTPEENKANVFPLHKATSSYSTDHGDFLTTSPLLKSSLTDSEKRINSVLATDGEYNVTTDIKTSVISISKKADMEMQLAFTPLTDLPVSISSRLTLHKATENASSPSSTTANKAHSILGPDRSLSGDESNKIVMQGSLAGSQNLKDINLEEESTKIAMQGSLAGSQTSKSIHLEAESTKITKQGSLTGSQTSKGINLEAELTKIAMQGSLAGSQTSKGINLDAELTKIAMQGSLAGSQTSKSIHLEAESIKIAKQGSLVGSQASKGITLEGESTKIAIQDFVAGSPTLKGINLKAESQLELADDKIFIANKSSHISAREFEQIVNQKQITNEVVSTETPIHEPVYSQDLNSITVISVKDFTLTSTVGSTASIDKTAQTENLVFKDFMTPAESAKDFLRTGKKSPRGSITSSVVPSIDIDQTDQFLVDIAFKFSRNGAAKQTILKSVDAESASNQLSGLNNIITHKSITSNLFEHPIEIPINPNHNISLKLNQKHKSPKEKRKSENKYSKLSFDMTSKHSNKAQKHGSVESNMRRKGLDINIVLETIYKEQLQPLERNIKKIQTEILLLTKEQAYIQRTIYNLTEKRSCIRPNRVKRSLSCICKRNI